MSADELFALPVGTRIRMDYSGMEGDGEIVECVDGEIKIHWDDGQDTIVSPDDDDPAEFAHSLELLDDPTPLFVNQAN